MSKAIQNIPDYDVEHSEVLLYHVRVLELLGEYGVAHEFLERNAKNRRIMDPLIVLEMQARLQTHLKRRDDANRLWKELIAFNPDCDAYLRGYINNHGIDIGKPANYVDEEKFTG